MTFIIIEIEYIELYKNINYLYKIIDSLVNSWGLMWLCECMALILPRRYLIVTLFPPPSSSTPGLPVQEHEVGSPSFFFIQGPSPALPL